MTIDPLCGSDPAREDGEIPCPRVGSLSDLDAQLDDALRQRIRRPGYRADI
jgi:hypothetical protein